MPDYPASLPTAPAWGGTNLGGAPAPMGGVYVNQAAFPPMAAGRGLSVVMQGDFLFINKKVIFSHYLGIKVSIHYVKG